MALSIRRAVTKKESCYDSPLRLSGSLGRRLVQALVTEEPQLEPLELQSRCTGALQCRLAPP